MDKTTDLEYHVLQVLSEIEQPVGSGMVAQRLQELGLDVSEATVGRMLHRLTSRDLAERVAFKGRKLTSDGHDRLSRLRIVREGRAQGEKLVAYIQQLGHDTLKDVLIARRAMEGETAALAAERGQEDEILGLRRLLDTSLKRIENHHEYRHEDDMAFHMGVAAMAHNRVLELGLSLVRRNDWLFPAFTYIRKRAGGRLSVDHLRILDAIAARDAESARRAMTDHLNSVMRDVESYARAELTDLESNGAASGSKQLMLGPDGRGIRRGLTGKP